ncbi:response regulator transcription factor [Mahella australiensis]|uniref:response regulator transcription factor n=1 Tax=Mahella australiensis TaxID=252966 RepID=UPI0005A2FB7A|nr:LuxR C-terminal-related transcriptional regulator [Mahella australiensis]
MPEKLTTREKEVLLCIINGINNQEITNKLLISKNTAKNHVYHIMRKMRVHRKTQVIKKAYDMLPQMISDQGNQVI